MKIEIICFNKVIKRCDGCKMENPFAYSNDPNCPNYQKCEIISPNHIDYLNYLLKQQKKNDMD